MVLIVFCALLARYLDRVPARHYCDFRVYYKAGQDFLAGKNIYFRESQEITPFKYSPFFAFVFAPLSLVSIKISAAVFFAVNFLSTLIFFRLSYYFARGYPLAASFLDRQRFWAYALVALCSVRYVFLVWDSGQVTILMCALVLAALSFMRKDKDLWAGFFFAAAILIKYTPFLFLPYLLFQRKFKLVCWSIFFIILFLVLPALGVGWEKNIFYLSSWLPSIISTSLDQYSYLYSKNQSIYSLFIRFFSWSQYHVNVTAFDFNQALMLGRLAAFLLYAMVFMPGPAKPKEWGIDIAMLLICMALFNPNGWMVNFVSLIFPFMLLVQYLIVVKGRDWFVLFLLIAGVFLINIMSKDFTGKTSENLGCAYSFTTFGALCIYVALLKLKFLK